MQNNANGDIHGVVTTLMSDGKPYEFQWLARELSKMGYSRSAISQCLSDMVADHDIEWVNGYLRDASRYTQPEFIALFMPDYKPPSTTVGMDTKIPDSLF